MLYSFATALTFAGTWTFAAAATIPTTFDYIVIGAGTSGATVAARLAEDANVTVAVIEAGTDVVNLEPISFIPGADVSNELHFHC